jgi:hypothetical protein
MFTVFQKSKDTFSRSIFPKRFQIPNVSIHTKEFFVGGYPSISEQTPPNRVEKQPDFNIQNFNFMNFRVDVETPI